MPVSKQYLKILKCTFNFFDEKYVIISYNIFLSQLKSTQLFYYYYFRDKIRTKCFEKKPQSMVEEYLQIHI